jgi:UDP:flavonoid glycosyltransferase YjiC (YdhE family)
VKVLIYTFGTQGDVQPYLALARALVERGHRAAICTAEGYLHLVRSAEVEYLRMNNDMLQLVQDAMPHMSGPRDAYKIFRAMGPAQRSALQDQWTAAQAYEPSIIVFHPKALGAYHVAEKLAVPAVLSLPLPFFTPTREFPVPFIGRWPLGGWANRLSYQFQRFTALAYGGMLNSFRADLDLPPIRRADAMLHDRTGRPLPILYPFSRHVRPIPADYPAHAHVTGYWFMDSPGSWTPPPELSRFLADGPTPVYVGFGSMGFGAGSDRRFAAIIDAVRAVGTRAIISSGWNKTATIDPGGDDVLVIESAPHDWLFPQVSAVIHHGGSGTTGAGLRAGRPTLICPVLGDQPFWAHQVHRLGAGPEPLPWRQLTAAKLEPRLRQLLTDASFKRVADNLSRLIATEDGPRTAATILESIQTRAFNQS